MGKAPIPGMARISIVQLLADAEAIPAEVSDGRLEAETIRNPTASVAIEY